MTENSKYNVYVSSEVIGTKFLSQRIVKENPYTETNSHYLVFHFTLSSTIGELIREKPVIYLKAIIVNSASLSQRSSVINPLSSKEKNHTLIIQDMKGKDREVIGHINDFNEYPLREISGFIEFDIPLRSGETLGTPILRIENL